MGNREHILNSKNFSTKAPRGNLNPPDLNFSHAEFNFRRIVVNACEPACGNRSGAVYYQKRKYVALANLGLIGSLSMQSLTSWTDGRFFVVPKIYIQRVTTGVFL